MGFGQIQSAKVTPFDPGATGLAATNVADAISELAGGGSNNYAGIYHVLSGQTVTVPEGRESFTTEAVLTVEGTLVIEGKVTING